MISTPLYILFLVRVLIQKVYKGTNGKDMAYLHEKMDNLQEFRMRNRKIEIRW